VDYGVGNYDDERSLIIVVNSRALQSGVTHGPNFSALKVCSD